MDSNVAKDANWAQSKKMQYIIQTLNNEKIDVHVLSCAYYGTYKYYYNRGFTTSISQYLILTKFPELKYKTIVGKAICKLIVYGHLINRLFKMKDEDVLIVYHSLIVSRIVYMVRKVKRIKIITEVEELYSLAFSNCTNDAKSEIKKISIADGYIFVNDILSSYLNSKKPSVYVYGSYYSYRNNHYNRVFNDNKIHIVYAGAFSIQNYGVFNAINSALFLNERYEMHILGYGDESIIDKVKETIERVNALSQCKVLYHGMLQGTEYDNFLLSCDIGLNPQKPGEYMETAFPSKVLAYLSHGLNVVTTSLKPLVVSQVAELLIMINDPNPELIANAITVSELKDKSFIYSRIELLDKNFRRGLVKLLS